MKKIHILKSAMMVLVSAVFAFACTTKEDLTPDTSLRDGDNGNLKAYLQQKGNPVQGNWRPIDDWYAADSLHMRFGFYEGNDLKDTKDTAKYVGPIQVEMYKADTVEVATKGFNPGKTSAVEKTGGEYNAAGLKEVRKIFAHNLGTTTVQMVATYKEAKIVFRGNEFTPSERPVDVNYTGADKVDPPYFSENSSWKYYKGTFSYELDADRDVERPYTGYYFQKIAQTPEDKLIDVKKVDEGFEPLTYFDNGNIKTGRSWMKLQPIYSVTGAQDVENYEVVLNYSQNAPSYAIEYLSDFAVSQINGSMSSESQNGSRTTTSGKGTISVRQLYRSYASGFTAAGKSYGKTFGFSREAATLTVYGREFAMVSPEYTGVSVIGFGNSNLADADGYERKLNIINVSASLANKPIALRGETELRVKKQEEPETFTETIISKGLRRLSSSTAYVWARIRRTSSKGGYTEEEKGVNINFFGTPDGEEEFVVPFFDTPASKSLSVGPEYKGSSRPSGDFTITVYTRTAKMSTENVSRNVVLTYDKPTLRLQKGNSYEYVDLPYIKYEDLVCQSVQTSSLINSMAGEQEWERKFYSYTLGATEKASESGTEFSDNPVTFTSNAVLKVAKEKPEDPRETPSWLGKPEWAKYTRVQREAGAKFEDMVVFGYTNGVVMCPDGKPNLETGVFAYTDADASKHGVEKCAKGSCYSGVWTGSKWIPAKITESDGRWIYTGYGKSHTVMANNAINLGIGKDVTHTPKHQSYEVTDNGNKITIHYSKNNASLSETDLISLK